jgi:hypothetical protein
MSTYAKIEQELRESGTMLDNIPAREVVGRKRK